LIIIDEVIHCVGECFNIPKHEIETFHEIVNDLGADELDTMDMVIQLEDAFSINISDEEASQFIYIQDVVNLVENKLKPE